MPDKSIWNILSGKFKEKWSSQKNSLTIQLPSTENIKFGDEFEVKWIVENGLLQIMYTKEIKKEE